MENPKKRDAATAARVKKVADIHKVSTRLVYYVIDGERENEAIMTTYMEFVEGENRLLEEVKKLVPFK